MATGIEGFFFGKRAKVPDFRTLNAGSIQKQTLADNLASVPEAEQLAAQFNMFSQEQLAKALEFSLPGGLAQVQKNIGAQLRGELDPEDTRALISSASAAGYGRGFGPSMGTRFGIGRNLVLRDLGLGVQDQKQRGFGNFLNLAQATKVPQFDFSSMFFTPQQRLSFEAEQRDSQFNRNWLAAQVEAEPNKAGAAIKQVMDATYQAGLSSASSL